MNPNQTLRQRAEEMLRMTATDIADMETEDVRKYLHELQVHQMELEIQNEELRDAQTELAHSRDRYSDLYEFAPVGYVTIDRQGIVRDANLAAARMLAVERKSLVERPLSAFIDGSSQDVWHLHRRNVFSAETKKSCELLIRPDDGAPLTVQLQSLAVQDDEGQVVQFRTALVDVTERRVAEAALSKLNIDLRNSLSQRTGDLDKSIEQVRLLSEAISHLGEGVMITEDDLNWPGPKIIFVNQAMCAITGYSADELLGQSPRILQGEQTDVVKLRQIRLQLNRRQPSITELRNYRKDGSWYDAEILITPLLDARGQLTNFVSICRDVSDRNRASKAMQQSEERLSLALQATSDAIWDLDLISGSIWWNDLYRRQFGSPANDVDPWQWWSESIHPDDVQRVFHTLRAFVEGQGEVDRWSAEYRVRRIDGTYALVADRALRSCDAKGKPVRVLGALVDITERRSLERQVLEISADEHRRIGSDLHDGIGQELTGLAMIADTLVTSLKRNSAVNELTIAEKIQRGVGRALAQVRSLARGMNPVDVDAQGLMSSLSEMSVRLGELYAIRCNFRCDQPVLLRDNQTATQLFRIAQEAMTNAFKHGQADSITVSISITSDGAVLQIRDNGIGIGDQTVLSKGVGLRTMGYRAGLVGGTLEIKTLDEGGTEVTCTVPRDALVTHQLQGD